MSAFRIENEDGVFVMTFDLPNESVNKINREVFEELDEVLARFESDASAKAGVLISGKRDNFIAGADVAEFATFESAEQVDQMVRAGQKLFSRFANYEKPFVAAIDGACLGGGLEIALACAYRVATSNPKTMLGLPEVQLGVIPALGGCQRLPRLIGVRAALDIILAGKVVPAKRAKRVGIVDELVHSAELKEVALKTAQRLAVGWRPKRKGGGFAGLLLDHNRIGRSVVFRTARKQVLKKTGGHYPAPFAAMDAVRVGLNRGMKIGLQREARHFAELAIGQISRNLIQIFFATTALKKDLGTDSDGVELRPVSKVGIVGAGFMGAAIGGVAALKCATDVRFRDADWERLARGLNLARGVLKSSMKRRRITRYEYRELVSLISGTTDWSGFGRTDLVIEAVFEDLSVKHDVFKQLEEVVSSDCVLASNTSTIPISKIASIAKRPERVVGMHFFSPVDRMPLLEVIATDDTDPSTTATAVSFGRDMGKTVIVVRDRPGFWVNRILHPYTGEAGRLLEEGAAIEMIDRAMTSFGFPVGPITLLDEVGIDVAVKAGGVMEEALGTTGPLETLKRVVASGRLGRKSGRGFYSYEKGKKRGVDRSVYEIIGARSGRVDETRARDRLVYSMLNEAANAIGEDVVRSPRDGDIGAIFGIGYPPFRGGPLRYIDQLGVSNVVATLNSLADTEGDRFRPVAILEGMASSNGRFYPSD